MKEENKRKILFISNGYGEDSIAASVIECMKELPPGVEIAGFPLVGCGGAYQSAGVPVIAPTLDLPSGGLIPGGWVKNLWMDFRSGLLSLTMRQASALCRIKNPAAVVAVGDTYPVLLGGLFAGGRVIFIGTAKSDYFVAYSPVEKAVFRRFCRMIFPRDEPTARTLCSSGLPAQWVGNAMMDGITVTGDRFGIPQDRTVITLLPGSRDFAYGDFPLMLEAAEMTAREWQDPLAFVSALAPSIGLDHLEKCAAGAGFTMKRNELKEGVVATLCKDGVEVLLLRGRFGDSIHLGHIVVGQAGTGNEQAAGLGKPAIGFDSEGRKRPGWYRARQKGLLGDSLAVVERDARAVKNKVVELLGSPGEYRRMSQAGLERLGPPGGAAKMAGYISRQVMENIERA